MTSNDSWQVVETVDVFDLINGYAFKSKEFLDSGTPVLKIKNVKAGKLSLSNLAYVDKSFINAKPEKVAQHNDLLISMSGNRHDGSMETWVGKVCWFGLDTQYLINQRVGILRLKPSVDANPRFLAYQLSSEGFQRHFIAVATSSGGQANLSPAQIKSTELLLPPRNIQDWIVSVAGKLEDKIQLNHQINQTLEQMAQAIFKSWFVDFEPVKAKIAALDAGGTESDALLAAMQVISGKDADQLTQMQAEQPEQYTELRATAELFPSAMQDSELGEIPEGWEVTTVADTAEIVKGKSYKSAELAESKTALVTLKSFNRGGGYRLDGLKEYTGKYKPKQEVMAGDLIIAYTDVTQAADVIGKPAMVIGDSRYDHLVISLDVAVVRPFEDALKPFLYGLAKTDGFQYHTRSHTTGTTVLHLAKNAVPGYEFALPLRPLIQAYTKQVNSLFSQIDQNVQQGRSLQALRDTLLPKLLSGELSIHQLMEDAEDE